ncbi:MAG: hypothetical protein ACRD1V_03360, partial [Vicinamibacterales bacterium]
MTSMRTIRRALCGIAILVAGTAAGLLAQGRGGAASATNDFYRFIYNGDEMEPITIPEHPIETKHTITVHGETIAYTAHVGFLPVKNATSGIVEGHLFYVYYSKDGVTENSKRPL